MTAELAIHPADSNASAGASTGRGEFDVNLDPPVLRPEWREGNAGVPGFITWTGALPGPHAVIVSLMHGNEIAGAIVVADMLAGKVRPVRGRLTMGFANLAAFDRFDPAQPTASRFVDEDLNRLWDLTVLEGAGKAVEIARARAMRRLIDDADVLLDLHSMLWPSEALWLCGGTPRGRQLAQQVGSPSLVVADSGHASGRRLIDYGRFSAATGDAVAVLVEAGQHWQPETVAQTRASLHGVLVRRGIIEGSVPPGQKTRFARVTQVVTAQTASFRFVEPYRGGDVIPRRGTLIALDGDHEIRTPHDDCLLVMPSLRTGRGHTAVRLARFEAARSEAA